MTSARDIRMNLIIALFVALYAIALATPASPDPSSGSFFTSLYSDHRATNVGDIVLVVVSESALASHTSTRGNENSSNASMGAGTGWLDFISLTGYGGQSKSAAKGQSQSRDMLSARIAAVVTGLAPNGNLIIQGERRVACNRDFQTVRITGEVRACDIRPDNTVSSQLVANAVIDYTGPDPAEPGGRVGLLPRILGWLF